MTDRRPVPPPAIGGLDACIALLHAGQVDAFDAAARDLVARYPRAGKPVQLAGVAALMKGRLQEAVDQLQAAARLNPNDASVWDNLGVALQRAGHNRAAVDCFQGSVRLNPGAANVWVNAAANFGDLGDYVLARNCAARAVELDPMLPDAHLNLGCALRHLGGGETALRALLRCLELDPDCAPAHMNLSRLLSSRGAMDLALHHARRARDIDPTYVDGKLAYTVLCGFVSEQVDAWRQHLRAHPMDRVGNQDLQWALLMDERETPQSLFDAQRAFGARFEPQYAAERQPCSNDRDPARQLRVGFLSGDFRRHPTADHIEPLWRGLDRGKMAVHAYHTAPGGDETTARLRELADAWHEVAQLGEEALASRIRADGIDILIDLAGHTTFNRLGTLLRKPAPLQMHWIGYPGSTGLSVIDYYIGDPILTPAAADAFCSEKVIRLPTYNNQQCMALAPEVSPLPALDRGYLTFAANGRANKINPRVIALWAKVLAAVPDSRMLIADASVEDFRARVLEGFAGNGIDAARIDFRPRTDEAAYMALHAEMDIVLDTFPFNGGTTATHALCMGVPVLTLPAPFVAGRMAAARLAAVGLHDWIARDEADFVARAVRHAQNIEDLVQLRAGLRQRLEEAPLRQIETFATAFEAGLRAAWMRWCAGQPTAAIDVVA